MKKALIRALALAVALLLLCPALFSCAPQPQPIEGEEAIRTLLLSSAPATDNFAKLIAPVWGDATQGLTFLARNDGENRRATVASPEGQERTLLIVDGTLYLYVKAPAEEEGAAPVEHRLSLTLDAEMAATLTDAYLARPFPPAALADIVLSGEERAYRMPDGNSQVISENPDVALLSEHTGYAFSDEKERKLFAVIGKEGQLSYLLIEGTAIGPDGLDTPLFLEYAFNYEEQALTAPADADAYTPATREEIAPLLPR